MITSEILVVSSFSLLIRCLIHFSVFCKDPIAAFAKMIDDIDGVRTSTTGKESPRRKKFNEHYENYKTLLEKNLLPWPMLLLLIFSSGGVLMLWG